MQQNERIEQLLDALKHEQAENVRLRAGLDGLRRAYHYGFYTATGEPLHSDYWCPAHTGQGKCDCGADVQNAAIDEILMETNRAQQR